MAFFVVHRQGSASRTGSAELQSERAAARPINRFPVRL